VLSALVVGSLAPDFHYFLNLAPDGRFSHTVRGIFLFCLPVGLAVLWIFHKLLKLPLISLAPERHQQRLVRFTKPFCWGPSSRFLLILFSLLVGALSHLAWDAFTHSRGFVVRNLPDMRTPPLGEFGSNRPLYNLLQLGSSVLGPSLLVFWYWRWFRREPPQPVPDWLQLNEAIKTWTVAVTLILTAVASLLDAYSYASSYSALLHVRWRQLFVGTSLVTFMSLVLIEAICFAVAWWWKARRRLAVGGKSAV
jgi:hypothetical protein